VAYAKIASSRYCGHKKAFMFDNYVEVHQAAHNTLAELDETVPETKKVMDFLASITDPRLSNARDLILGDTQKLQDFKDCKHYLKTLVYNKTTHEKYERQITGLQQMCNPGKGKDSKGKDGKLKRAGGKDGDVSSWQYSKAEWLKLTLNSDLKSRS